MSKRYKSKKHKKEFGKKIKRDLIIYTLFLFCVLFAIGYFSRYDNFEFKNIEVVGVENDYEEEVKLFVEKIFNSTSFLGLVSRGTPVTYPKGYIKRELLNMFPKINRVSLKSVDDNTLKIVISEKGPYSLWCSDSCYLVDVLGLPFEEVDEQYVDDTLIYVNDDLNTINLGENIVSEKGLSDIKYIIEGVVGHGYVISEFKITDESFYDVLLDSGTTLKFIPQKDVSVQIENLKTTFSDRNGNTDISMYEYIDLRFENRIYTKNKGFLETEYVD